MVVAISEKRCGFYDHTCQDKYKVRQNGLLIIRMRVLDTPGTQRGGAESVRAVFITFSTFIINNLFNIMHYHIIIISSSALLSSSYHHHYIESITTQYTGFLRGNPSLGGKTTEAFLIIAVQK